MNIKNKILRIFLNSLPIILMILLIPFVKNDYFLTLLYIIIITTSLLIKYEKKDYLFFIFGLIIMTVSELFFISTGVETFNRNSLFGLMPIWLPFIWACAFVAIKRVIIILNTKAK